MAVDLAGRRATPAVVGDGQRHAAVAPVDGDVDALGVGVLDDVAQRLLGGAEHHALGVLGQAQRRVGAQVGDQPARGQRGEQVGERGGEALLVQRGRIEVDEQRAQLAHAAPGLVRGLLDEPGLLLLAAALELVGGRGEGERHAGELLDGPVVQVARDARALVLRRVQRALQQLLALALAAAQAAQQRPCERHLRGLEQQHRADQGGREDQPQPPAAGRHRAEAVVGLEEQRRPLGAADPQVDLEQLLLAPLVAVLGLGEVRDLRVDGLVLERLALLGADLEALPDQAVLVGVDDATVGPPQLHADHRPPEDAAVDHDVHAADRVGIAAQQRPVDPRRDDPVPGEARHLLGLANRFLGAAAAHDLNRRQAEQRDRHEAAQDELRQGPRGPGGLARLVGGAHRDAPVIVLGPMSDGERAASRAILVTMLSGSRRSARQPDQGVGHVVVVLGDGAQ